MWQERHSGDGQASGHVLAVGELMFKACFLSLKGLYSSCGNTAQLEKKGTWRQMSPRWRVSNELREGNMVFVGIYPSTSQTWLPRLMEA